MATGCGTIGAHGALVQLLVASVERKHEVGPVHRFHMAVLARMTSLGFSSKDDLSGNSTETQKCGNPGCPTGSACCAGTYQAVAYDGTVFCQLAPVR